MSDSPSNPVLGRMWISMTCMCHPPQMLTSDENPRCAKCGMDIVIGNYAPAPRLTLIQGDAA